MAGYIFTLDNIDSLRSIATSGVYSTKFNIINTTYWRTHHEGTFADYFSMKPGDNVYFFNKRKIYGIGILTEIQNNCIFLNFPNADVPEVPHDLDSESMILNHSAEDKNKRFLCTFTGAPNIFKKGMDMDEVLASNPTAFKMLRALWKLSFVKVDDIENQALFDCILKHNESNIDDSHNTFLFDRTTHDRIADLYNEEYNPVSKNILHIASQNNKIKHEMAIEAAIIDYLIKSSRNTIFGNWNYISHQVVASPFKPIDYMDKMDIFGYRKVRGYSTISKYLMIEIKKDTAKDDVINQAMKYVDWIEKEYSRDYSMIEAFIVAHKFPQSVIDLRNYEARRFYTKGRTPAETYEWSNLRLMEYEYHEDRKIIEFNEIDAIR